jgi:hypothetical protein
MRCQADRFFRSDQQDAMTPPASLTVGPSPLKILGKVTIAAVAGTAGVCIFIVFMACSGNQWPLSNASIIIPCTAALFACYCGIAVLGAIIWGRPRIEIGPDGFVDHGILGHRLRRWSDIEGDFAVIRVGLQFGLQSVVAYHVTSAFKESARIKPIRSLAGYDEAILIGGELAIGARELAEVLNRWKQGVPTATPSA